MSIMYIQVKEEGSDQAIELPLEDDQTLDLATLQSQFPGAIGLKYVSDSGNWRGLKVNGTTIDHPGKEWSESIKYVVTYNKDNNKRKADDGPDGNRAKRAPMPSDLIVLNMPYHISEEEMRDYFEKFGSLSFYQLKKKPDGSSRGFGFIRFKNMDDQKSCLRESHQMGDRDLQVKVPQSKAAGFDDVLTGSGETRLSRRIHVGNVTSRVTKQDLEDYFGHFGPITDVFMPKPTESRKNPMYAFLTFADASDAQTLIESESSHKVAGETLTVAYASPINKEQGRRNADTAFSDMMDQFVDQAYSGKLGVEKPRSKMEAIGMSMAMMKRWMETQTNETDHFASSDYDRYRSSDNYRGQSYGQGYGTMFSQGGGYGSQDYGRSGGPSGGYRY